MYFNLNILYLSKLCSENLNSDFTIFADNSGHAPRDTHGEPTYRKEEVEDFFQRAFKMPNYQVIYGLCCLCVCALVCKNVHICALMLMLAFKMPPKNI